MATVTTELVEEVCNQYSQDGLSFRLLNLDNEGRRIELALEFEGVECMDCVMPAEHLERLIASSLKKQIDVPVEIKLHDPRVESKMGSTAIPISVPGVIVLDPTTSTLAGNVSPGPDAGRLRGKTVLFRIDVLWESWDWIVDEWSRLLGDANVKVLTWRRSQGSWGGEAERLQAEYVSLIQSSDALISGLGNCGSCSVSTVSDALAGLTLDVPTLTVVTTYFATLAHHLAENSGRPALRIFELPHPLSQRPEDEVRQIARDNFPSMLVALGATL
ncbi:UGSC family (seleno)protein [Paraburkholderia sp. RL17-347-BIC-D]|uniref:UGSC family (seleno)protein n=1 Tax=Paraburkholderia sp. RL17-347-BIC-D TaxID=3031632 RepID=UPI0038BBC18C